MNGQSAGRAVEWRTMQSRVALPLALLLGPAPALASPGYDRCVSPIDLNALTSSQRLDCATRDMDRADAALNAASRAAMARLPPPRQSALSDAERRWIDQRRSTCALERQAADPSRELDRMLCLVRETDARTEAIGAAR